MIKVATSEERVNKLTIFFSPFAYAETKHRIPPVLKSSLVKHVMLSGIICLLRCHTIATLFRDGISMTLYLF